MQRQISGQHAHAIVTDWKLEAELARHCTTASLSDMDKANSLVVGYILHRW